MLTGLAQIGGEKLQIVTCEKLRVKRELRQRRKEEAETKKWFWSEAYVLVQRLKTFPGSSKRLI